MLEDAWTLIGGKLLSWRDTLFGSLPNLVVAVLVIAVFYLLGRVAGDLTRRSTERLLDAGTLTQVASSFVRLAVFCLGVFVALELLGLDKAVTSLLAGAGIVGLAIGFAFQDLVANFIAGVLLAYRRPFTVGELISTNGHLGFVRKLNLRNTFVETFGGQMVIIPNRQVFENAVENFSYTGFRRIDFVVPIPFEHNLDKAKQGIEGALGRLPWLAAERPPTAFALECGPRGFEMQVRYWIAYPGDKDFFAATHEGLETVRQTLAELGIPLQYPIRTLDTSRVDPALLGGDPSHTRA